LVILTGDRAALVSRLSIDQEFVAVDGDGGFRRGGAGADERRDCEKRKG